MAHVVAIERLRITDDQGRTRRQVLEQFAERTGKRHPDLDVPLPHPALVYLLDWWRELDRRRADALVPLSHQEISCWAAMTRRSPTRDDLDCLWRMDDACLQVHIEAVKQRAEREKQKAKR